MNALSFKTNKFGAMWFLLLNSIQFRIHAIFWKGYLYCLPGSNIKTWTVTKLAVKFFGWTQVRFTSPNPFPVVERNSYFGFDFSEQAFVYSYDVSTVGLGKKKPLNQLLVGIFHSLIVLYFKCDEIFYLTIVDMRMTFLFLLDIDWEEVYKKTLMFKNKKKASGVKPSHTWHVMMEIFAWVG